MVRPYSPGFLICLFIFATVLLKAQGSAGTDDALESRYLIDVQTAGMLSHGSVALDADFFQSGGVLGAVSVGAFDRILLGISYGGIHVIGSDSPVWNNTPGFHVKVRAIEETIVLPAIALGFSSQGKEMYVDNLSRYAIKSPGFYAVGSKNYRAYGFLSIHGGVNYSLERADGDSDINFFCGAEKTLGPFLSLIAEYDLGMNDSNKEALGRGRGYLNFSLRASIGNGLSLAFALKDLAQNQQDITIGNRIIQLEFVQSN